MLRILFYLKYLINKLINVKQFIIENPASYKLLVAQVSIDLLHIHIRLRQLQLKVYGSAYKNNHWTNLNFNSEFPNFMQEESKVLTQIIQIFVSMYTFGYITICVLDLEVN